MSQPSPDSVLHSEHPLFHLNCAANIHSGEDYAHDSDGKTEAQRGWPALPRAE